MQSQTLELWNNNPSGSSAALQIKELKNEDLEGVAHLHREVFSDPHALPSSGALQAFYKSVFLDSPFASKASPSLVAMEGGAVKGFVGVLTREFALAGEKIFIGIGSRFMVAPSVSGLVAASLLRRAARSKIDVFFTDGANEFGGASMRALGGVEIPLYGIQWFKVLRPFRFLSSFVKNRSSILGQLCSGISRPLDLMAGPLLAPVGNASGEWEDLSPKDIVELCGSSSSLYSLVPQYQTFEVEWLLDFCDKSSRRGRFFSKKLPLSEANFGGIVGFLRPNGIFEILNLWVPGKRIAEGFKALLSFAYSHGAVAVQGRMDDLFFSSLRGEKVIMKHGSWVFACGKNKAAIDAIQKGKALMGGLEGELWLPSARHGHT